MLPATENLTLYRGDTVRLVRRFKGSDGEYLDLTGCSAKAQIRTTSTAADVLVEFDCSLTDQVTTKGGVVLAIPAGLTGDLPGNALWDMQLTHVDLSVRTYLEGTVTAKGQVTR